MKLRPFFSYYGSKFRHPSRPPRYPLIIEPFAGSACFSIKYPSRQVLLNDINPVIAGIWDYLIHVSEKEILALPDYVEHIDDVKSCPEAKGLIGYSVKRGANIPQKTSKEWTDPAKALIGFNFTNERPESYPLKRPPPRAAKHLKSPEQNLIGFNLNQGSVYPCNTPSKWLRNEGKNPNSQYWGPKKKALIASQLHCIRHWKIQCGDYTSCPDVEAAWFVDPPYSTPAGSHYKHKFNDFEKLAEWVKSRQGQVEVCDQVGADWLPFTKVQDAATAGKGRRSQEAVYRKGTGLFQ